MLLFHVFVYKCQSFKNDAIFLASKFSLPCLPSKGPIDP